MRNPTSALSAAVLALALAGVFAVPAAAQKIVCWKDKSGKVVGCGDTVPPEYRDSAAKELDSRGLTRRNVESAEEAAKRRKQEQDLASKKEEDRKRAAEQKRQDSALLNTYANAEEIDQRRDRDLQQVDLQVVQMRASLKNATDRLNDARKRNSKDDIARATAEEEKIEQNIAAREKEKGEIREKYAAQKKRYLELRGDGRSATAPAPAPAQKK
ncbi:MAG: hypothetical protein HY526_01365 [Betaproteobacteria bacterium]|nr:hypothetical protein [Betaproteobacteria bacterium]